MSDITSVPAKKLALFITPHIPNRNGTGAEKRAWVHLTALAREQRVIMALISWGQRLSAGHISQLGDFCSETVILSCPSRERRVPTRFPGPRLLGAVVALSRGGDRLVHDSQECLEGILLRAPPDVVFCFRSQAGALWERFGKKVVRHDTPVIVDFDDIYSIALYREFLIKKAALGFEAGSVALLNVCHQKYLERMLMRQASAILVCSENDKKHLTSKRPKTVIHVVPNAIHIAKLTARSGLSEEINILFVGTMSYSPNEDGALFFCRHVLPIIQKKFEGKIRVTLVGFRPPETILALESGQTVRVVGDAETIDQYYMEADIVVCPIRFGGGTRIKILEAMSFARPVVSTTIGAEGISVTNGENILIADGEEAFAAACLRLARSSKLRVSLGQAGYDLVKERYAIEKVQARLSEVVSALA